MNTIEYLTLIENMILKVIRNFEEEKKRLQSRHEDLKQIKSRGFFKQHQHNLKHFWNIFLEDIGCKSLLSR
jgi:hypothetical protein